MNNQMDNRPDRNRPNRNNPDNQGPNKNRQSILAFLICLLISLVCLSFVTDMMSDKSSEITYDKFIEMVDKDQVKEVTLQSGVLTVVPKIQKSAYQNVNYKVNQMESVDSLTKRLEGTDIVFRYEQPDAMGEFVSTMISVLLPTVVLFFMLMFFMRRMNKGGSGIMGVGKSRAKAYIQKETGVTFKNVAGQEEAKESLQEVVDFLHNPGKYTAIGAKLPKGALLVGPPGTGKTLLAKAVAGEANVPFFSLSGSEFVEMFVGVGASRVRDLFEEAKKNAPCIVFIDEIDAIGKSRDSRYGGGNDEREQTLNQLLAEMDGFDTSKGLLILAATNRPEVLDPALLRPGRFDRRIIVDRPDLKGRVEILKVHAKDVMLDETVDLEAIALATSGAVGSDLANMINEAAILAVKNGRRAVSQKDLQESVEVVLVGKEKKDRILSPQERRIVSYHEVGHALVNALQKDAEPVQKITIVPRTMGALGYVLYIIIALAGGSMAIAGLGNVSIGGEPVLTLGTIAAFLTLSRNFINPIAQVSQQLNSVVMALAGAARIFEFLDRPSEEDHGTVTLVNAHEDADGNLTECKEHTGIWAWKDDGELIRMRGKINLKDVDFSYEEGVPVLHDITVYAEPGQKIALVGATGAGKTTITNLINRFYDIDDGKIQYDGININRICKEDLRRSLGVVLQDVNLFTGSVMENIRYGRLDATDEECIQAAKLVNADGFIRMLPKGYDTVLKGDGSGLSQGQRQLISIARAAVADPPVMILDEATSSIDTRTETIVQRGMDNLMKGRTVFVIAHRLSTVQNSDVIMVMENGRIIERGNHEQLIAEKGKYYQLYNGAFELE